MAFLDERDRRDIEWIITLGVGAWFVRQLEASGKSFSQMLSDMFTMGPPGHLTPFGSPNFIAPDSLPQGAGMPDQGPAMQVPTVRTAYDPAGMSEFFRQALSRAGWGSAVNVTPEQWGNAIAMLKAHTAAETTSSLPQFKGQPWTAVYNFNIGNITFTGRGQYHVLKTYAGELKFVAYNMPAQGADAYVDLLGRKYGALDPAAAGDPNAFVDSLLRGHYLGPKDDPEAYRRNIVANYRKFRATETVSGPHFPVLKLGSRGYYVEMWQRIIGVKDDGAFGPVTDAKTREWQETHLLEVDGIVGPKTWNVAISVAPIPSGAA